MLVHDGDGNGYAAAIIIGFLMYKNKNNLADTLRFVASKRRSVDIPEDIWKKLCRFETQLRSNAK
jgi:hypothetical protein